jgi:cytochrome c-type biogenesis protein CcmH/NrfF
MNVAVQAQHSVKRLKKGGLSAVMVVDFMVATYAGALKAVMRLCTMTIDV